MLVFIAGLAAAFFIFRALGAQRSSGILRRAFWCCYVLWAVLAVYIASGHQDLKVAAVMLVGPLVLYRMVLFVVQG